MTETAAMPVEVPMLKAAGRGRGQAKAGRGRGKGKAKGKAKKMTKPVLAEGEEAAPKPKKEPKLNLRAQVEQEIGDRDIEVVIKEVRTQVEALQAAVAKAQEGELAYETDILNGKSKMETASAEVDSCIHKETLALEKFKAARQALIGAEKKVTEKKLELGDEAKALNVLESHTETMSGQADLIKAKKEAAEAKEAAKKAYEEAVAKEREATEAIKAKRNALAITDDPAAAEKAAADAKRDAEEEQAKREAKTLGKVAAKDLHKEVSDLEKQRSERDKERAKMFKEAAGLGKAGKKRLALGDAASPAAKGAKIQDVD